MNNQELYLLWLEAHGCEDNEKSYQEFNDQLIIGKLFDKQNELYDRLENLEGCEDNPVYAQEIKEIRAELEEVNSALHY